MKYYAMIGAIGYHAVEADDDDDARAKIRNALCWRGDGIYARWCRFGMRVAVFKRGLFSMIEKSIGNHKSVRSCTFIAN